ncbi:MAG: hypothetical protein H6981_06315 [Gammaproteobacteria bacterium]|nr:hypothetical protein [Gammaproteobacteria bacterium]MCP5136396.1 hypothetical protein [Gammaproteobacteria bacterium]
MRDVLRCADISLAALQTLFGRYGLRTEWVLDNADIPGSFWGDDEAGLIGDRLLVRTDTPVHSALHEAGHYVCMDAQRRSGLHTNAGGDYDEENGVCYLQILWASELPGMGAKRMFTDMDNWGYSFRLGSAQAWFERDADDARAWLRAHAIIDAQDRPTGRLRE